jgi:hypothetical protein
MVLPVKFEGGLSMSILRNEQLFTKKKDVQKFTFSKKFQFFKRFQNPPTFTISKRDQFWRPSWLAKGLSTRPLQWARAVYQLSGITFLFYPTFEKVGQNFFCVLSLEDGLCICGDRFGFCADNGRLESP